jgi:hypothetical protein
MEIVASFTPRPRNPQGKSSLNPWGRGRSAGEEDGKLKEMPCSGLQWHNIHSIFHDNWSSGSKVERDSVMNSAIFWDIKPCSPLSVNRRFGGTYRLHIQCREIS